MEKQSYLEGYELILKQEKASFQNMHSLLTLFYNKNKHINKDLFKENNKD